MILKNYLSILKLQDYRIIQRSSTRQWVIAASIPAEAFKFSRKKGIQVKNTKDRLLFEIDEFDIIKNWATKKGR